MAKRAYALYRRPRNVPRQTRWTQVGGAMSHASAARFWQTILIYGDGSGDEFRLRPIDNPSLRSGPGSEQEVIL